MLIVKTFNLFRRASYALLRIRSDVPLYGLAILFYLLQISTIVRMGTVRFDLFRSDAWTLPGLGRPSTRLRSSHGKKLNFHTRSTSSCTQIFTDCGESEFNQTLGPPFRTSVSR